MQSEAEGEDEIVNKELEIKEERREDGNREEEVQGQEERRVGEKRE